MRRLRIGLGAAGVVVLVVVMAWMVDVRAHRSRVVRDVVLAGHRVGGLDLAALERQVAGIEAEARAAVVRVRVDGKPSFTLAGADIGLEIDRAATVRKTMAVGRRGNVVSRIVRWASSALRPTTAPLRVRADHDAVYRLVEERDRGRTPAVEPRIKSAGTTVEAVPGRNGRGVDADDVLRAMPGAAREGFPIEVRVRRGSVAPRHPLAAARALADEAERLTTSPLRVSAGRSAESGANAVVAARTVRSWVTARPEGSKLVIALEPEAVVRTLQRVLSDAGGKATDARFSVSGGQVQVIAGRDGSRCCAEQAAAMVEAALLAGRTSVRGLPLKPLRPDFDTSDARALSIVEPIASFSTNHPAGQPRVANIHRIADLLQGTVIRPGQTFSVNKAVGPRTVARGFVNAPVIEDGKFAEGIGGGVSQYATTLFNAAFLGGLEFVEYQSHSIYLSRYPYGREATLNFPRPDLRIRNPSSSGVLIWAGYSDTAVTVTLYSTRFAETTQTGQTKTPRGECTLVRTERSRRFLRDGATKSDHVNALYRPKEGVNCP